MVKECPKHGRFEDVMSIDTEFSQHLEEVFPGRDIKRPQRREAPPPWLLDREVRPRRRC